MNAINDRDHAIVIGSGVGGLTAAAVLSPIFKKVTIIEKDDLPDHWEHRKGIPQGDHLHSLLLGGQRLLDIIYPGFTKLLINNGAVKLRGGLNQRIYEYGQWMPVHDLGFDIIAQSRCLLEKLAFEQTSALANVEIIDKSSVQEILLDKNQCACGVKFLDQDKNLQEIEANIIVDSSGQGGYFVKKLSKLFPDMEKMDSMPTNLAYSTAVLEKPPEWLDSKINILIMPEPSHSAGGALLDIENNQWCVSLHGRNGIIPPSDFEDWKAFAKTVIPDPAIWERVKDAKLVGAFRLFRKPNSYWRRFDLMQNLPGGYYPLGDTVSGVNPIFGQGMTVAFGHAVSLREAFEENPKNTDASSSYLSKTAIWSGRAWKRIRAYDTMFIQSEIDQSAHTEKMRTLALARHKQFQQDPSLYREAIMQGQMLF